MKEQLSTSYIDAMRAQHAAKPLQQPMCVAMTGAANSNSIGRSILRLLANEHLEPDALPDDVRAPWSPLDRYGALVLCHGVCHLDWLEEAPLEKVKEIIDVNLFGTYAMIAKFVKETTFRPWRKRIVVVGSMAYNRILNGSAAYCASKAGLAHLVRCAAWELAPKGFDVFAVHPSNTLDTPMSEATIRQLARYRDLSPADARSYWETGLLRERHLTKGEIANLVHWLLTSETGYLSGTQFDLAGGAR